MIPPGIPFQANKLGMLIVAALGPELIPGLISISQLCVCALLRLDTVQAPLSSVGEPSILAIFAIAAVVLLFVRIRGRKMELALAKAEAEAEAARELNRTFLLLHDLANTPLQTIELGLTLLRTRYPKEERVTESMLRATERLRSLRQLLADRQVEASRSATHTGAGAEAEAEAEAEVERAADAHTAHA